MGKRILKIYIFVALAAAAYTLWYELTGLGISCYYLTTRGYECPGCGLSRMAFAMLRLQFGKAFIFNPVGFVSFFVWNAVAMLCLWKKIRFVRKPVFLYSMLFLTVAAFLIQGLLRNLC